MSTKLRTDRHRHPHRKSITNHHQPPQSMNTVLQSSTLLQQARKLTSLLRQCRSHTNCLRVNVEFPLIFDRPAQVPTVFIFHKIAPLIDDPKKFQSDLIFSVKENSYKPPPPAAAPSEQYPPSTVPKKKQHFFHYVNFPAWNEFEFGWNKGENKKNQSVANDWWKKEELRSMHSQHFKNLYEN